MMTIKQTREMVKDLSSGYCEKCCELAELGEKEEIEQGTEVHHKLSNSKINRKRFPLFVNSIFNLQLLCYDCHHNKPVDKIRAEQAAVYEEWLQNFKGKR